MRVKAIRVELELADGQFTRRIIRADSALKSFGRTAATTAGKVDKADRSSQGFGKSLRDMVIVAGLARSAINNLHLATTSWVAGIVKANAKLERLQALMYGMSGASTAADKTREAADNVAYLIDMAQNAPFSIESLSDSFVKMKSVGLDPTTGALRSLTDAVANFGGDSAVLHRASIAIQQMAGKGVISMEELRQQLGEAVPSAIKLMARSVNMTFQELVDKISKGEVEASTALANMFSEFNKTFGGSAQRLMNTWIGMTARLQTRWMLFQKAIGDAGFFNEAKRSLADLIDMLDTKQTEEFARSFGEGLAVVIKGLREVIEWFLKFRGVVGETALVLAGIFTARALGSGIASISLAVANLTKRFIGLTAASGGAKFAIARQVVEYQRFNNVTRTTAIRMVGISRALGMVRVGLSALFGPIGIAIALLYEGAQYFDLFGSKAEEAFDKIRKGSEFLTEEEIKAAEDKLAESTKRIAVMREKMSLEGQSESNKNFLRKEIEREQKEIAGIQVGLEEAKQEQVTREVKRGVQSRLESYQEELEAVRRRYVDEAVEIDKARQAEGVTEEQRAEIDAKAIANRKRYHSEMLAQINERIAADKAELAALGQNETLKRKILSESIDAMNRKYIEAQTDRDMDPFAKVKIASGKDITENLTGKQTDWLRYKVKIAEVTAELKGLSGEAAKMAAKHSLIPPVEPTTEEIAALAAASEKLSEKLKAQNKSASETASAMEDLGEVVAHNTNKANIAASTLFNGATAGVSTGYANLEKRLDSLISKISQGGGALELAQSMAKDALEQYRRQEILSNAEELQSQTKSMRRQLMTRRDRIAAELADEEDRVKRMIDLSQLEADERVRVEGILQENLAAMRETAQREMEGPMEQMAREWEDVSTQMENAGAGWVESFVDTLVDGMEEGKMSFSDFATSVISDILKIAIKAQMVKLMVGEDGGGGIIGSVVSGIGSAIGGLFGTSSTSAASGLGDFYTVDELGAATAHTGGIAKGLMGNMQRVSADMFAAAERYHTGGIAGLKSDEVPAVLQKGEGVFTQDQMKALGGMGRPSVTVNVINQSGQQMQAEQKGMKFDARGMIIDVVLSEARKPGAFRDGIKEVARS